MKTLLRLIREARPIWKWLGVSSLISLVSVALVLIGPELLGRLTDAVYSYWASRQAIDMPWFIRLCFLLAGIYIVSAVCDLLTMLIMNNVVSNYYTCGMRIKISDKIRRLPVKYVDDTPNGEVISLMTKDVSVLGISIHNFFNILITGFIKLLGIAAIVFWIHPLMAVAVITTVPLSLFLAAKIAGGSEKYFTKYSDTNGKIYAFNEENFTGFETVKAFNMEERQKKEQAALCEEAREQAEKGYFLAGVVQPVVGMTNNITYIAICLLGGWLAVRGSLTVGDVVAFILYAKLFAGPLEGIANGLSMMQNTFASAARVFEILDLPEVDEIEEPRDIRDEGNIVFEHVNFSYKKDRPLIEDLNINVRSGQKVAIVGPTGGGKTTIVNLLMRFYDLDSGRILIDGTDIMTMNRGELRAKFSMVLQDTWLFSGTVYENIAYGKENATREEVMEAARQAKIDHFIHTLPQGYDTLINEDSTNISSGQKQLLTIARAYLADRKVLILDEATSNVDTRTEILIQHTMDALMKNRTSFVIAHRLSTIVNADIILVVHEGRIVEQGTHKELLAKGGFYSEIYNSQYDLLK
jgi:ATP-binding cassette subfamily B protein